MTELRTPRLLLRPWKDGDFEPFAAMNADPRVMEHYPTVLTREQSDHFVRERILPQFERRGYGPWALEVAGITPFAGYVGLLEHSFEAPFTPCVEVGWRLAFRYWGHGYATEGARAALTYGFDVVGLDEIVSFTAVTNARVDRGDGTPRNDPRRRVRAPPATRGAPTPATRPLPPTSRNLGQKRRRTDLILIRVLTPICPYLWRSLGARTWVLFRRSCS